MYVPFARSALAVALLGCTLPALANEPVNLDAMVVSASGFEQKITDAPASISVISGEALKKRRVASLAEALTDVEGVDVSGSPGKTGGLNISIRGMGSAYTLILVDGKRQDIAGNVTPNGFGETKTSFLPPVNAIERIEVIRGPMSTLYGSDAMGGVINIITKKVSPEWTGSVTAETTLQEHDEYGSSKGTNAYLSGPLVEDKLGLTLRGKWQERDASDLTYKGLNGIEVPLASGYSPVESDLWSGGGRLSFTPNEAHEVLLDYEKSEQTYDNSTGQLGTLGAAGGYEKEQQYKREQYSLTHTGRFAFGTLETGLTRNTTETVGRMVPTALNSIPGVSAGGKRMLEGENTIFDIKLLSSIGNHNFTIGGQHWETELDNGLNSQPLEFTMKALFLEDEWHLRDDLALTLGVRHDRHSDFGSNTSPRAYLVWNTNDNWTIKGGVSKAFRAPSVDELTDGIADIRGQGHSPVPGNPDLKPETSTSAELGFYFDNLEDFNANLTLFRNEFKDKLTSQAVWNCEAPAGDGTGGTRVPSEPCITIPGGPWHDNWSRVAYNNTSFNKPVNVDEAITQGVEIAGRYQLAPAWSLSANYTYTDTEQKSGENNGWPLNDTPRHQLNASLNWQTTDRLNTWIRGEYRSERFRRTDGQIDLAYEALGDYKAYTLFHLGGSYRVTENFDLNATIYNLFDKDFVSYKRHVNNSAGTEFAYSNEYNNNQERRRLWLSATYHF